MAKSSVKRINQSDLIDELADNFSGIYDRRTIQDIVCTLENTILNHLRSATVDKPVSIRPFKGLTLSSKMLSEKEITMNLTGRTYVRSERLKPSASFSRYFRTNILNKE